MAGLTDRLPAHLEAAEPDTRDPRPSSFPASRSALKEPTFRSFTTQKSTNRKSTEQSKEAR